MHSFNPQVLVQPPMYQKSPLALHRLHNYQGISYMYRKLKCPQCAYCVMHVYELQGHYTYTLQTLVIHIYFNLALLEMSMVQ